MMKDSGNARIKIIFVLTMAALVLVYIYAVAPFFLEKTDALIADNKQIEHDLKEVEDMGSDTESMKTGIEDAKKQLAELEKKMETDGDNYDMNISKMADESDIEITEMMVDEQVAMGSPGDDGRTLYLQPVTISFVGSFSDGIKFIEALENSETGVYRIRDFLCSNEEESEGDEKSWMVGVSVYYYGESSSR